MRGRCKEAAAAAAGFAALAAVLWGKALLGKHALFYDTLYFLFFPNYAFLVRCLHERAFPFWNPFIYGGVPFLANMQSAVFYPFTYVHALLPFARALAVCTWAHTFLAGMFMYLCARKLGLSLGGAAVAGIVFCLNGNFVFRYVYPSNYHSYVWLPLVFYFLLRARDSGWKWILAAAAAEALQVFAGHPQFAFYSGIWLAAWAALTPGRVKSAALLALLAAGAFLLAAVQLIPSLRFAGDSVRAFGLGYDWASAYSIPVKEFLTMLVAPQWSLYFTPKSGDPHVVGFYFGPFVLAACALAVARRKDRCLPFLCLAILGGVLSLGKYVPGYHWLFVHFAPMRLFRFPAQALYLVCMSVPILAGMGADALPETPRWVLAGLCAADLMAFGWRGIVWINPEAYAADTPIRALMSDKAGTDRFFLTPRTRHTLSMAGKTSLDAWLRFKDVLHPNLGMTYGFYAADGQEELRYARYESLMDRVSKNPVSPWMDVLGVRYVLTFWDLPRGKFIPVAKTTGKIFGNPQAFPKAYLAASATYVPDERAADYVEAHGSEEILRSPLLARASLSGATSSSESAEADSDAGAPENVRLEEYSPNRVSIESETKTPKWLVLTDAWDPGWSATINGKPARVERANFVQRAVRVPRGRSITVFRYRPPGFKLAAFLTVLAWIWTGLLLVAL